MYDYSCKVCTLTICKWSYTYNTSDLTLCIDHNILYFHYSITTRRIQWTLTHLLLYMWKQSLAVYTTSATIWKDGHLINWVKFAEALTFLRMPILYFSFRFSLRRSRSSLSTDSVFSVLSRPPSLRDWRQAANFSVSFSCRWEHFKLLRQKRRKGKTVTPYL